MLQKWLEPSIEARTTEIFNQIFTLEENCDFLKKIKSVDDVSAKDKFDLENSFILLTRQIVEDAYKKGMVDGLGLIK